MFGVLVRNEKKIRTIDYGIEMMPRPAGSERKAPAS